MNDKKVSPAVLRKQGFLLGMGLTLIIDGILICLVNFHLINVTLKQIWPLFVVIAGFCFLGSDLFIYRRLRTAFLFPSIMLIFLGVAFLVFSSDVFNISFRKFISVCWPIVLVVFGILLLSVYGIQRINNKQFPYMQDDTLEEDNY
ncbi:hypothetical protein [Treponema sp.]|uniref:hypothetical protein n=1 Tax=Treponema sp. TaxID=166 RepID=UPI00388D0BD0